jgi:AcrR family transcriptional regulator
MPPRAAGPTARRQPTQQRSHERLERILSVAKELVAHHGSDALKMSEIAGRAEISIGSLYQYFPNKDAILAQLLIRHIDRGSWAEADRLDLSPGTLRDTVQALVRDAIDSHSEGPQLLRIMIEEAPRSQDLLDAVDRHGRIRTAQIRELLTRHPDVRVGDVGTAADLILFTIEINTHKMMAAPGSVPVETFATELADMVTRYLRGD